MAHIDKANKRRKVSRGPFTSRFLPLGRTLKDSADHGIAQIGRLGTCHPLRKTMRVHLNEEILSYLRRGTMQHKDSDRNKVGIHSRHLMLMNAGSGIHHEEGVPEGDETVEMLQVFIRPEAGDLKPKV